MWHPSRIQSIIIFTIVILTAWRAGKNDWSGASVALAVGVMFVGIFQYNRH